MKISITLPSLSNELLNRTLDNIVDTVYEHDIEVLAVTPFPVVGLYNAHFSVKWIEDIYQSGNVRAHWQGLIHATGDFITPFVDDHAYIPGWDSLAVENFLRREKSGRRPFVLGLRQIREDPRVGVVFGIYYPYFPFMRLSDARTIGWFDPVYKRGFADIDLALNVWTAGGRCEWADVQTIVILPEDKVRNDALGDDINSWEDTHTFRKKWAPIYGNGGWYLPDARAWNQNLPMSAFTPEERTCLRNARFS